MSFDFMENSLIDDDARFMNLCQLIEDAIKTVDAGDSKYTDLEVMQAIDYVGFNFFRHDWVEFKKIDSTEDIAFGRYKKPDGKKFIN
jgi:hypothetical protein